MMNTQAQLATLVSRARNETRTLEEQSDRHGISQPIVPPTPALLSLSQLETQSREFADRLQRSQPTDARSQGQMFLAVNQLDTSAMERNLRTLDIQVSQGHFDPGAPCDIEQFVRNEQENLLSIAMEVATRSTIEDADAAYLRHIEKSWLDERARLADDLDLIKPLFAEAPFSAPNAQYHVPQGRTVDDRTFMFAGAVLQCGRDTSNLASAIFQVCLQSHSFTEDQRFSWRMISGMFDPHLDEWGKHVPALSNTTSLDSSMALRMPLMMEPSVAVAVAARRWLQRDFLEYMKRRVKKNAQEAIPGGSLQIENLVRAYLRSVPPKHTQGWPQVDTDNWSVVYGCIRSGQWDEACRVADSMGASEFARLLRAYPGQKPSQRSQAPEIAVLCESLVYGTDNAISTGETMEEWMWQQLMLCRNQPDKIVTLQQQIEQLGLDYFGDVMRYFTILCLVGSFDKAIQLLVRVGPLALDGVHFGMVFGSRGMLAEDTWVSLNKLILQQCTVHLKADLKTALNYSRYLGGKGREESLQQFLVNCDVTQHLVLFSEADHATSIRSFLSDAEFVNVVRGAAAKAYSSGLYLHAGLLDQAARDWESLVAHTAVCLAVAIDSAIRSQPNLRAPPTVEPVKEIFGKVEHQLLEMAESARPQPTNITTLQCLRSIADFFKYAFAGHTEQAMMVVREKLANFLPLHTRLVQEKQAEFRLQNHLVIKLTPNVILGCAYLLNESREHQEMFNALLQFSNTFHMVSDELMRLQMTRNYVQ
eukprot:c10600_g1_i1.p1 GENE.c10600_g1_i1~~c10600_g1_i1.p1  ORF type:complete len:776 (-),score=198.17 c10600_g1_i1:84-2366(-)